MCARRHCEGWPGPGPVRYTRTTFVRMFVRSNAATDPYLVLPSLFTSCRSTLVDVVVVLGECSPTLERAFLGKEHGF